LAGAIGGLMGALLLALASPLILRLRSLAPELWRDPSVLVQLTHSGLQIAAGLGLGFLFWLSWGLAAVVRVPWWTRGLIFALVCWAVLIVPVLAASALAVRRSSAMIFASEWLCICVCSGLSSAWTWTHGG